jgi:hypothetical protein
VGPLGSGVLLKSLLALYSLSGIVSATTSSAAL